MSINKGETQMFDLMFVMILIGVIAIMVKIYINETR